MEKLPHQGNARFDVARGLASLIVFFSHSTQIFIWRLLGNDSWFETVAGNAARQAVLVFFVLSGYLITKSIINNIKRNGYFEPSDYLISRAARIYPPFLFALAVTILAAAIINRFDMPLGTVRPNLHYGIMEIPNALILSNGLTVPNGPLWTLYIEVQFYLIAFAVAALFFGRSISLKLLGCAVGAFAIYRCHTLYNAGFFAIVWLIGALGNWLSPRIIRIASIQSFALLVVFLVLGPFLNSNVMDSRANEVLQIACCVIYTDLVISHRGLELPYPSWLVRTGDYSYTLYVLHFPILLLGLALSLSAIGSSLALTIVAMIALMAIIIGIVIWVAPNLENTLKFKRLLSSCLTVASRTRKHQTR